MKCMGGEHRTFVSHALSGISRSNREVSGRIGMPRDGNEVNRVIAGLVGPKPPVVLSAVDKGKLDAESGADTDGRLFDKDVSAVVLFDNAFGKG